MLKNDEVRLRHILDAAREAVGFCVGMSRRDLDSDRKLSLSLVRLLEVIGEAARGVSAELRASQPEVAWDEMAGMRDRLIHGYYDVDLDIVWQTVREDLPPAILVWRVPSRFTMCPLWHGHPGRVPARAGRPCHIAAL